MSKAHNYKRILIVRLDRLGDVLLSTPVIKAVRDAYPESHIAFMVRPYAREVVEGNPYLDEVIVYDKAKGLLGIASVISTLIRRKFDLAIILHPTARTHLVTYLARIPERVGLDRKMGWLLTKKIPHTKQYGLRHEIDYTLEILRHLGIEPRGRILHMPADERSEDGVAKLFSERGITPKDTLVVMNPGASCRSKRWIAERFAQVGDILAQKHKAKVVLISARADKGCADAVARAMKSPCANLAGMTTVSDVASILRHAKLFISNDSGPVHIACSVGTPVIALFGRSDRGLGPKRWGPSNKEDVVLHKDVGCAVCMAHNCSRGFKCLEAITVDDVLAAADKILRR